MDNPNFNRYFDPYSYHQEQPRQQQNLRQQGGSASVFCGSSIRTNYNNDANTSHLNQFRLLSQAIDVLKEYRTIDQDVEMTIEQ